MKKIKRLFQGRINRTQWLIGNALTIVPLVVVGIIQNVLFRMAVESSLSMSFVVQSGVVLGLIAFLVVFLGGVSLNVRRLHDLGHSGWTILAAMVPLVNIAFYFYLALKPGTSERNNYGEPPIKRGTFSALFNA